MSPHSKYSRSMVMVLGDILLLVLRLVAQQRQLTVHSHRVLHSVRDSNQPHRHSKIGSGICRSYDCTLDSFLL